MPECGVLTDCGTECQRRTDGGPCFMHSDGGPPSSHGAPSGNDNAVGNSGGGAPKGNFNAGIHAGFSDWRKHYERLAPDAREWADKYAESLITRSKADLPDSEIETRAREAGTLAHMWDCAAVDTFERGWVIEREETHEPTGKIYTVARSNPALRAELAISRRKRAIARELRVYHTPDGLPHDEQ